MVKKMHYINFDEDKIVSCVQIKAVYKAIECPVANNPVFLVSGNCWRVSPPGAGAG